MIDIGRDIGDMECFWRNVDALDLDVAMLGNDSVFENVEFEVRNESDFSQRVGFISSIKREVFGIIYFEFVAKPSGIAQVVFGLSGK